VRCRETPAEIGTPVGINTAVGAVVVLVCCAAPPHLDASGAAARFAVLALGVAAFTASVGDPAAAAVTAGVAFLLFDGFVVDHAGDLTWHGDADLVRLVVLAAAACTGLTARASREVLRRRRARKSVGGARAVPALPRPRTAQNPAARDSREVR
jgi:hypothetical protein